MQATLHFSASEALYDEGGPLAGSDQRDTLELGPFEGVYLTYEYLRVGPTGDHIAAFGDGAWVIGFDAPSEFHGLVFSDIGLEVS